MNTREVHNTLSHIVRLIELDSKNEALNYLNSSRLIDYYISNQMPIDDKLNDLIIDIMEFLGHTDLDFTTKEIIIDRFNDLNPH